MSLDSLDEDVFQAMNDVGFPVAKVLEGIEAAVAAGLGPVKINAKMSGRFRSIALGEKTGDHAGQYISHPPGCHTGISRWINKDLSVRMGNYGSGAF